MNPYLVAMVALVACTLRVALRLPERWSIGRQGAVVLELDIEDAQLVVDGPTLESGNCAD